MRATELRRENMLVCCREIQNAAQPRLQSSFWKAPENTVHVLFGGMPKRKAKALQREAREAAANMPAQIAEPEPPSKKMASMLSPELMESMSTGYGVRLAAPPKASPPCLEIGRGRRTWLVVPRGWLASTPSGSVLRSASLLIPTKPSGHELAEVRRSVITVVARTDTHACPERYRRVLCRPRRAAHQSLCLGLGTRCIAAMPRRTVQMIATC